MGRRSPPGAEGLVRGVFEAEADEFEGFEVNEFLVADLPLEAAVVDGGGEFVTDEGGDLLAARGAEGGPVDTPPTADPAAGRFVLDRPHHLITVTWE